MESIWKVYGDNMKKFLISLLMISMLSFPAFSQNSWKIMALNTNTHSINQTNQIIDMSGAISIKVPYSNTTNDAARVDYVNSIVPTNSFILALGAGLTNDITGTGTNTTNTISVSSIVVTNNYSSSLTLGTNLTVAGSLVVSNGLTAIGNVSIGSAATVDQWTYYVWGNWNCRYSTATLSSSAPWFTSGGNALTKMGMNQDVLGMKLYSENATSDGSVLDMFLGPTNVVIYTNTVIAGSLTVSNGMTVSGPVISLSTSIPVADGTGTISNTSSSWYCNLTTTTVFVVDSTFSATNGDVSIGINISGTNSFSFLPAYFTQIYTNAAVTNQINHYVAYLGWGETTNGGFLLSGSHHK